MPQSSSVARALGAAVVLSSATAEVMDRVKRYAPARKPVVFVGDTGTGKSFFAQILHELSGRKGPFMDVTAAEIHPDRAESQIFGHLRGAFTGAISRRAGLLNASQGGSLLFDDFHLMEPSVQALLLRTIETGRYRPMGADRDLDLDSRILFGVGDDLDKLVAEKKLLKDLRWRMGLCVVTVPPLSKRTEEIGSLAHRFLQDQLSDLADGPQRVVDAAVALLELRTYAGNLRELRGLIEDAFLTARSRGAPVVDVEDVADQLLDDVRFDRTDHPRVKRAKVAWALCKAGGCISDAAKLLGADRRTVAIVSRELRSSASRTRRWMRP